MKTIDIASGVKVFQEDGFSILFGCPPEIIKYFMIEKIPFPDYVLIPDTLHHRGVLQNATEFVLYYHLFILQNFNKGKKLKILGEPRHVNNNRELLRLTLLGPSREEYDELDPEHENPYFEDLYRESRQLSLKDESGNEVPVDGFVDFFSFENGMLETQDFQLFHRDINIYEINGNTIDVNLTEEQIPPYDLNPNLVPLTPSIFGIDVLGGGSGFTPTKPCSGLILNYNSEYMLIDCVPYLEHSLNARGISRNQIKSIFLSHIHDDHCNIFPLVLFHDKVKFLCTKEIFWMACRKLSLMTDHDIMEFYSYFDFVELEPYETNDFYGVSIIPHYTVHSIPCIGATFKMCCNGHTRSMVVVGDNKAMPEIKKMVDDGIVGEEKYQRLHGLYNDEYDLLIADGGLGILHGDPRDSLSSKSNRVVFLHMEKMPDEFNTTFTTAIHGKRFTLKEGKDEGYIVKTIQILNQHYPGISEEWENALISNVRILKYNTGDVIMKQGDISNGEAYVILSGNVHVLFHDGKELRQQAVNQAGDLVGEMAILNNEKIRSASVVAGIPVTLAAIDGEVLYSFLRIENRIESIQKMLKTRSILERLFRSHGISVITAQHIAYAGKWKKIIKGEIVLEQGAPGSDLFFILDGKFSVTRNGKRIKVLGPMNIFGEFGIVGAGSRQATVKALEEAEVMQVQRDDILPVIRSTPALHFFINQLVKEREREFMMI